MEISNFTKTCLQVGNIDIFLFILEKDQQFFKQKQEAIKDRISKTQGKRAQIGESLEDLDLVSSVNQNKAREIRALKDLSLKFIQKTLELVIQMSKDSCLERSQRKLTLRPAEGAGEQEPPAQGSQLLNTLLSLDEKNRTGKSDFSLIREFDEFLYTENGFWILNLKLRKLFEDPEACTETLFETIIQLSDSFRPELASSAFNAQYNQDLYFRCFISLVSALEIWNRTPFRYQSLILKKIISTLKSHPEIA